MIVKGAAYMKTLNTMHIVPMTEVNVLREFSKVNNKLITAAKTKSITPRNPITLICSSKRKKEMEV
jgi:effector-binding domain-containing protein